MIHHVMSVRDAKSELFGRPFFARSLGEAVRSFDDEVNRVGEGNVLNAHSGDFSLWQVATFDDSDGSVVAMVPKLVIQGSEVRKVIPMPGISKV